MRIAWWAGFLGTGVVLSGSLGACGGYSSLGEIPGNGGEGGEADGVGGGMSMGAKGGQGHGGTRATGGTGMGAIGGTGMGAIGGTGMGAVGGGSEPTPCMTDVDCPTPPPYCNMCADGTSECARAVCTDSVCGIEQPTCQGFPEPVICMIDSDCPPPPPNNCTVCADGTSACTAFACIDNNCILDPHVCPGEPEPVPCMTAEECPNPSPCSDRAVCPVAYCSMGYCGLTLPGEPLPCMTDAECPTPSCEMRPDGVSCPVGVCSGGYCGQTLPTPENPALDFFAIMCDPSLDNANTMEPAAADFMNSTCAKNFCHGKNFVVGLDLRPDAGFAQRLLDAPALHGGIPCPNDITMECVPDSCPAPGTVKLIDSADPAASWMLTTTRDHGGCGDPMPDANGLTGAKLACFTAIVNATAALK